MTRISYLVAILLAISFSLFGQTENRKQKSSLIDKQTGSDTPEYYVSVNEFPEPVGGMTTIVGNVRYPESAIKAKIEGTVLVEAFVDQTGTVVKTNVLRGVREDLDGAAQDAIKRTRFKPGMLLGKAVNVRMAIPIRFKLKSPPSSDPVLGSVDQPTVKVLQGPSKLIEQITYPGLPIKAGIHGTVFAIVELDEYRELRQVKILHGPGGSCSQRVLKALASYDWARDPTYYPTLEAKTVEPRTIEVEVAFLLPKK